MTPWPYIDFIWRKKRTLIQQGRSSWEGGKVRGWEGGKVGREAKVLHTYRQTYIHKYIQTYRPSGEAGCREAFAPKM